MIKVKTIAGVLSLLSQNPFNVEWISQLQGTLQRPPLTLTLTVPMSEPKGKIM